MTDDLGPLRQAMSDLSEHGGSADLYERTLRRSRQTQRRATIATGVAAATVVFAIGGTVAFVAGHRPDASTPAAAPSGAGPGQPDCPSVETLGSLVELPPDWSFASPQVQCVQTWATADVKRPSGGNIRYLFHYTAEVGWRYQDQGAGWDCKKLGLTQPAPFCTS
ncbi:hypothetical protein AB0B63_24975 [Micromonospora sp. NPDC049081]|uniref:hypothetical protein n=1 Tax=Micromonospora sp. NPDC049081 TaxID=3155150 RepID=UPI0033F5862A